MKKLLVLNFFPAFYPASSGGEQRYFYLYSYLSRHFDVTLLSSTYPNVRGELVQMSSSFREHRIPKEGVHLKIHAELAARHVGPEVSGLTCALAAGRETGYRRAYLEHVRSADIVIHECPHMLDYDEFLGRDGKPRVYNSYNLEFLLARDIFNAGTGDAYAAHIHALERRLVNVSSRVFVTCADEARSFTEWYDCQRDKVAVVPNGFEPSLMSSDSEEPAVTLTRPFVVFVGSAHPPNVTAARYVLDTLAPKFSHVSFVIVGSVCNALRVGTANSHLLGHVDERVKNWLLRNCIAALNPMAQGAGTNLKIVDYLAQGATVITTPFGSRGLTAIDGEHCHVRRLDEFEDCLSTVIRDPGSSLRMGKAGADLVHGNYTWEAIAGKAAEELDRVAPGRTTFHPQRDRKRLLVVNDFPVDQPVGGGQVRVYELLHELALTFDVTLLCLTPEPDRRVTILAPHFRQVAIPKTSEHHRIEARVDGMFHASAADVISLLVCCDNPELIQEFQNRAQTADAIIFEHPFMAGLRDLVPRGIPTVYGSQNEETALKQRTIAAHPLYPELLEAVTLAEAHLLSTADLVVCVSQQDAEQFRRRGCERPILVVPNGVRLDHPATVRDCPADGDRMTAVFVGSSHPPNLEALRFITENLAPVLPDFQFQILGSVCTAVSQADVPANVSLLGFLAVEQKLDVLRSATVALNPMFSGSGSNLKLADYMAAGVPVVSTPFGTRGYDVQDRVHLWLAGAEDFAAAIDELCRNKSARQYLVRAGLDYAEKSLAWSSIARSYDSELRRLIDRSSSNTTNTPRKSLLVITYRYTDVPAGGAEVYLSKLLQEISASGDFDIDLCTCDVETIENRFHFSAEYTRATPPRLTPEFVRNLFTFPVEMPTQTEVLSGARTLCELWNRESLVQARQFLPVYDQTILMGGWNWAEHDANGDSFRWTSSRSEIFCAGAIIGIEITGTAAVKTAARVHFQSETLYADEVKGEFVWHLNLPAHTGGVLSIECDTHRVDKDPRALGVCIQSLRVKGQSGTVGALPLASDFETLIRSRDPDTWVESLVRIAEARDRDKDELFARIRGPHSKRLCDFLYARGHEYDVALIQGVPFSITPDTLRCAAEISLPAVLLPHFHMEDRYYHWQSFYDCFRTAHSVLAFPDAAQRVFFDRIGAASASVPGGGINPEDFTELTAAKRNFADAYRSSDPFVLFLGRKTGAKNYASIVAAIELLRRKGLAINLVMIGPDEDQVPIERPFVSVMGRQPWDIVMGALASSVAVVNMSESESFGIVLLESWMCGRPVIANRACSAFTELVDHSVDGLLCSGSVELADAISMMVSEPLLAAEMGRRGREKALEKYTWAAVAKQVTRVLSDCVDLRHRTERSLAMSSLKTR